MGLLFTDKISGKQYTSLGTTARAAGTNFLSSAAFGHYRAPNGGASHQYSGGVALAFAANAPTAVSIVFNVRSSLTEGGTAALVTVQFSNLKIGDVYKCGPMVYTSTGPNVYPLLEEY